MTTAVVEIPRENWKLSFYNDSKIRKRRIARAKSHVESDMLRTGRVIRSSTRGCSVGCDLLDLWGYKDAEACLTPHAAVANHDGTPAWLEHLRDVVFESLGSINRPRWHVDLAYAIPVGSDLRAIPHQFMSWIVSNDFLGSPEVPGKNRFSPDSRQMLGKIRRLHDKAASGSRVSAATWIKLQEEIDAKLPEGNYAHKLVQISLQKGDQAAERYAMLGAGYGHWSNGQMGYRQRSAAWQAVSKKVIKLLRKRGVSDYFKRTGRQPGPDFLRPTKEEAVA